MFVETVMHFFSGFFFDEFQVQKNFIYLTWKNFVIFTVTFDQFTVSFRIKGINKVLKKLWKHFFSRKTMYCCIVHNKTRNVF